jgi:hypothetical protein
MAKPPRSRPAAQSPLGRPTLTPHVESLIVGDTRPQPPAAPARVTESVTPEVPDSVSLEVPRYLTMVRKEARVRADQADALAALRRRLSRTRTERSETLTDNSLIRIAVDLLLSHSDQLHGNTEDELRESVIRTEGS